MTTLDALGAPTPTLVRDGWGRPLVIPPQGGKPIAYTRCTTFIGGIEDMYTLGQWQQRHAVKGVAHHDDLLAAVRAADLARDKAALNDLVDEAKLRSGAKDSASIGTWLHKITENADRGIEEDVPMPWLAVPRDPTDFLPDVAAYLTATERLKAVEIEAFSVLDGSNIRVAGTSDRIVKYQGKRYIADLKTGQINLGALKIAAQLSVYCRSHLYDWKAAWALGNTATVAQAKELRVPPGVETDRGIAIHLPQGTGTCELYWVDLVEGWRAVLLARDIREKRTVKFRDVMTSFTGDIDHVPIPPASGPGQPVFDLGVRISTLATVDGIRDLWRDNEAAWTDELTALAKTRIAQLTSTNS